MPLNFEGEYLEKLLAETQRPRYKHINTYLFMYQCLSSCTPSLYLEQNCPYLYLKGKPKTVDHRGLLVVRKQGGKRLGDETSSPLFKRCVMRRSTGTSALSALPVRLVAGKIYLSTNRKSHFLSLFFSQPCTMIKTFFHSPGSQVKMFMSACILVNLLHSKLARNELNLRVSNACSCRKT